MKKTIRMLLNVLCGLALLTNVSSAQAAEKDASKKASAVTAMHLHHMHTMMSHGLIMVCRDRTW